jgi:hypothetical protein
MSNKQQTAVDWYIDELYKLNVKFLNSRYDNQMTTVQYNDCKEQIKKKAKEMEKEQMIDAYWHVNKDDIHFDDLREEDDGEIWYNETYGGNT